jgi:hypothetical protein
MKEYKIFKPPSNLLGKKKENYSKKESKQLFDFIMSIKDERINFFLEFINIKLEEDMSKDLNEFSEVVFHFLNLSQFSEKQNDRVMLTNPGFSFCFDLGLFIGDLIITQMSDVTWEIGKGPKTYQGKNMPVLRNEKEEYDILGIAIHSSQYSLNKNKKKDWHDQYSTMIKTFTDPDWYKKEYDF